MIPKEHGGWAMLLTPYIIGLGVAGGFGLESALFLVGIILVFMASEPLGILIKASRTQNKRKNTSMARALRWLLFYLSTAGVVTAPLVVFYQRWWLGLFGVLGLAFLGVQGVVESRKLARTTFGEMVGALGLSLSAPGAYYATVGELGSTAFLLWLLTALHSAGSVFYINMRLRHHLAKGKRMSVLSRLSLGGDTVVYLIILSTVLIGLTYLGHLPLLALVAFLPLVCKAVKGIYQAKPDFSFKHLGFVELANSIAFTVMMILSYVIA